MKVIVSLTSIPSRFDKLPFVVAALTTQACHEVWVNIPKKYNRFPDWDGSFPSHLFTDPKIKLNLNCEDYGPATKFIPPALTGEVDIIVYVDDDTSYNTRMVTNLLKWYQTDTQSAWGLSGFNFETYFEGSFPRQHGVPLDVLEGYGGVLVKAEWIRQVHREFTELLELTWHDDMILCNLLEKYGISRKTVFTPDCNIGQLKQYDYGFGQDALHHLTGDGTHVNNNKRILQSFEDKGKLFYKYKCS